VTAGETWPAIAARAGVPLEDLLEINGVARVGPLSPGQVVYVLEPTGGSAPAPPPMISAEDDRLAWPLHAPRVSSPFGTREGRPHEGIDLAAPTGTPVHAAGDGFVLYAGDGVSGYGHMVVLQHAGDLLTVYAHNSVVVVKMGDRVRRGQEIARVGQSGRATAPHLHFEVRRGEVPRDPLAHLPPLP
jgi:murein DD-endopeptidase MepM/ murein hydrolase activator NlpD